MAELIETPFFPNSCPAALKKYGLWIFKYHEEFCSPPSLPKIFRFYRFYSLSYLIRGKGWFITERINMREINPGKAIMVTPGTKQGYGGLDSEYVEDSICFFGPLADRMKAAGIIEDGVFELGNSRKLLPIIQLARIPAVNSQFKANMMLQELLLDMYLTRTEGNAGNDSNERIKQMLDVLHKNPYKWWTVKELAEQAELSLPQFRRLFHKETGISPKMYIMQLKMKNSGEDLLQRDMNINQIALKYGFKDSYHFSSFFKKQTGLSPTNYRLLNT